MAIWQGGRVEALAVAPGIPGLDEQERRDRVPSGTYRTLAQSGLLGIADGLRVQPRPARLWESIRTRWGIPVSLVCDRFRLADLQDAVKGACPIEPRVSRWSEAFRRHPVAEGLRPRMGRLRSLRVTGCYWLPVLP